MNLDTKGLKLLGKVDSQLLKKNEAWLDAVEVGRREWFFIDYSPDDFPINSSFDTLLIGKEKKLIPETIGIKIISILDQMGREEKLIPKGYKMIALLEFKPSMPNSISSLPTLQTWKYNPGSITIMNHSQVQLAPAEEDLRSTYRSYWLTIRLLTNSTLMGKSEFLSEIQEFLNTDRSNADRIIHEMESLGYIREEHGNLVLADPDGQYNSSL